MVKNEKAVNFPVKIKKGEVKGDRKMPVPADYKKGGLTPRERTFADHYFKTSGVRPGLSAIFAGYAPKWARIQATAALGRPRVKAYLRKLWEEAESPIIMSVRERKEKLSKIARGMVGETFEGEGEIDWEAVKKMAAVKEVTVTEWEGGKGGRAKSRTIRVKLYNPVESIAELNKMDKVYRASEGGTNIKPTYNYYITDGAVVEKLERLGDRAQKAIEITGRVIEEEDGS